MAISGIGSLFGSGQIAHKNQSRTSTVHEGESVPDSVQLSGGSKSDGHNAFVDGMAKLRSTWKMATTTLDLNEKEKAQVQRASGTLKKLAGPDGQWNSKDLADNVQSIKGGLKGLIERSAGPGIAESSLREGFKEMSGKDVAPLSNANKKEAEGRWNVKGPEGQKKATITRKEMDQFKSTMDIIKAKSVEKGLPASKFSQGIPANFLDQVAENQPAWMLKLNSMLPPQESR